MANNYCSSKALWEKVSAAFVKTSQEAIKLELENATQQLRLGLDVFNETESPYVTVTKEPENSYADLLATICTITNLEEDMAEKLMKIYLMNDFRGAGKTITEYIQLDSNKINLVNDIWMSYYKEQIYLLHCIKVILYYSDTYEHPYQNIFHEFVKTVDKDEMLERIIGQIERLSNKDWTSWKSSIWINVNSDKFAECWYSYKMWAQVLLAHIALYLLQHVSSTPSQILRLYDAYKSQRFGFNNGWKSVTIDNYLVLEQHVACSQMAVLVTLFLQPVGSGVVTATLYDEFWSRIKTIEGWNYDCVLLLACGLSELVEVKYRDGLVHNSLTGNKIKENGNLQPLYKYFDMVKTIKDDPVETIIFNDGMCLMNYFLDRYTVDVTSNELNFYQIVSKLLSNPSIAAEFWKSFYPRVTDLYKLAFDIFPCKINPIVLLTTSMNANPLSANQIMAKIKNIEYYTEILDHTHEYALYPAGEMTCPVDRLVMHGMFKIPKGTIGIVNSDGGYLHWKINYNFWDVIFLEMTNYTNIEHPDDIVTEHTILMLNCVYACLKSRNVTDQMTRAIEHVFKIAAKISKEKKLPMAIVACILKISKLVLETHIEEVCNVLVRNNLIPYCEPNLGPQSTRISLTKLYKPGFYAQIVETSKCCPDTAKALQQYFKILCKLIEDPKANPNIINAGFNLIAECFIPEHQRIVFTNVIDREILLLSSLKIFYAGLTPLKQTPYSEDWKRICVQIILKSNASIPLLKMAVTGERTLDHVMFNQSSHFTGKGRIVLERVQRSLCLLNLAMKNRHYILSEEGEVCSLISYIKALYDMGYNIYIKLANYLHSSGYPQITTMAIKVLEKLFEVSDMSLSAYMSQADETIYQMFTLKLLAEDEFPPLRAAIIDLLATCIRINTQARLLEVLFCPGDVEKETRTAVPANECDTSLKLSHVEEWMIGVVKSVAEDPSKATGAVYVSILKLICVCWKQESNFLTLKLGNQENFWNYLSAPLVANHQETTAYSIIFRIICFEAVRTAKEITNVNECVVTFMNGAWLKWPYYVASPLIDSLEKNEKPSQDALELLQAWKDFMITIFCTKDASNSALHMEIQISTCLEIVTTLMETNNNNDVDISHIASVIIFLMMDNEKHWSAWEEKFPDQIIKLMEITHLKYIYLSSDVRTVLLSIFTFAFNHSKIFSKKLCAARNQIVIWLAKMVADETEYVCKMSHGKGATFLYTCVSSAFCTLKPYTEICVQFGESGILRNMMINAEYLIKLKSDHISANMAISTIATISHERGTAKYLVTQELLGLLDSVVSCRPNITDRGWETIYEKALDLCVNLMKYEPAVALKYVTYFVLQHQQQVTDTFRLVHHRLDTHGLAIILKLSKIFRMFFNMKPVLPLAIFEFLDYTQASMLICVDLCILLVTRPKINITNFHDISAVKSDFTSLTKRSIALLNICSECLGGLFKLTSSGCTSILQQHTKVPDPAGHLRIIDSSTNSGPCLFRDYTPCLSFWHLNNLNVYCLQIILKQNKVSLSHERRESGETNEQLMKRAAIKAFDNAYAFIMAQAKAHSRDPLLTAAARTAFIKEITTELDYLIQLWKRERTKIRLMLEEAKQAQGRQRKARRAIVLTDIDTAVDWRSPASKK